MARLTKEIMDYLHSIENKDGNLKHLSLNAPELQKLRAMLGIDPVVRGNNVVNKERIQELCEEKGMSQQTVSAKLGKHKSWMSSTFSSGRTAYENIVQLADFFGVEPEEITQQEATNA